MNENRRQVGCSVMSDLEQACEGSLVLSLVHISDSSTIDTLSASQSHSNGGGFVCFVIFIQWLRLFCCCCCCCSYFSSFRAKLISTNISVLAFNDWTASQMVFEWKMHSNSIGTMLVTYIMTHYLSSPSLMLLLFFFTNFVE